MSPVVLLVAAGAAALFLLQKKDEPRGERCRDEKLPGMLATMAEWLLNAPLGAEMAPDLYPGSGSEGPLLVSSEVLLDAAQTFERGGYPKMAKCLRDRAAELAREESTA